MNTVSRRLSERSRDQFVEGGGADRVEAGGRLVEEQQLRVQRQGAGQAGALDHAAGQFRGLEARPRRPAGRPARSSDRRALDLALAMSVCSNIGAATFSMTVRFENRAPCWNSTPQRRSIASSSRRVACWMSWPNTLTRARLRGRCRPMMVLSSTDLPAPEPPTTPTTSPRGTVRLRPSWTTWSPNRETRSLTSMIGGRVFGRGRRRLGRAWRAHSSSSM